MVFEGEYALFRSATFKNITNFYSTTFKNSVTFNCVKFEDEVQFAHTIFEGETQFSSATFEDGSDFSSTMFKDETSFYSATFKNKVIFRHTNLESETSFNSAIFKCEADFDYSSLFKAHFERVNLQNCSFESSVLDRCVFFDSDLRGSNWYGTIFRDVRINSGTRLLGSPDGSDSECVVNDERYKNSGILDWLKNICIEFALFWFILLNFVTSKSWYSVVEGRFVSFGGSDGDVVSIDKARDAYKSIEDLGRRSGLGSVQSSAFVQRQDINAREYLLESLDGDSRSDRFWGFMSYCRARVARFSLLYGESPWRILGVGLLCILVFSVLYPLGGWLKPVGGSVITYGRVLEEPLLFLESVYFSTLTFTTLGLGDYVPVGLGRVLVAFNTVSGAVLVALLVFVLGRRAAR